MNWIDRVSDSFARFLDGGMHLDQRASSGYGISVPGYQVDQPRWLDGNIETYRKAFASQVAVYSCVLARARGVSSAPVRVYQEQAGDRTELPDHPMRLLMQRPNPMMSEAEWLVMTQTLMDATGFAAVEKVRAGAGNVVELWHLRSDWLKEIRRKQRPSDWEYRVPGNPPVTLKSDDVLILPGGPATDLGSTGMSPIAVALREIGIDAGLTDFLKLFIEHGGTPPYALVTPNAVRDQEEADLLRGLFEQTYGGFKNWTKTALLSGGLDVKRIGSTLDEFAYPELRALTEAHVCAVFGVPPIIAGIQAGLDAATYSNYAQARRAFFEDTIAGLWARLDGALTRGLLSEFTDDQTISLEFDTSAVAALQEDKGAVWTRVQGLLGTAGMTVNQAQMAIGLPGFGDAGDVLLLPLNLQPIRPDDLAVLADQTAEPPQPMPAALTGGGSDGQGGTGDSGGSAVDPSSDQTAKSGDRGGEGQGQRTVSRPAQTGASGGGVIRTLPFETRARIATTNRRNVNRIAAKFAPRLRTLYRRQGERVAAAYTRRSDASGAAGRRGYAEQAVQGHQAGSLSEVRWGDGASAGRGLAVDHASHDVSPDAQTDALSLGTRDLVDIPWGDLESEMLRELNGLYEAAGVLAFGSTAAALGVTIAWDLGNPFVRQTMQKLARRVVGINATTRQDVARVITSGMEAGLTTPQIADRLKGLFVETYKGRAMAIARTESQVSYNTATADAYRESGIVHAMMCHDNPLHVDDYGAEDGLSCAQRNGVITDVNEVQLHIFSEHPNGTLAVSPLLVSPLGAA